MRATAMLALLLSALAPTGAGAGVPRRIACCVLVSIPELAPEPRCLVVHFAVRPRRFAAGRRRFCKLVGGRPVVHGECTCPAAPLPPPAS